jgi:hypothetical protein
LEVDVDYKQRQNRMFDAMVECVLMQRPSNCGKDLRWLDRHIAEQKHNIDLMKSIASPQTPAELCEAIKEEDEYERNKI